MPLHVTDQPVPLRTDDGGVIRFGQTRVSLDSVVRAYQQGATAEQIQEDFPTLDLVDIHAVISYYLRHPDDVNKYLVSQRQKADELREQIEADPRTQIVRHRLIVRRAQRSNV